jgi:hypothetical protein
MAVVVDAVLVGVADDEIHRAPLGIGSALLEEDLHAIEVHAGDRGRLAPGEAQAKAELRGVEVGGGQDIADAQARMVLFAVDLRHRGEGHSIEYTERDGCVKKRQAAGAPAAPDRTEASPPSAGPRGPGRCEARHWSEIGNPKAEDREILSWAREHGLLSSRTTSTSATCSRSPMLRAPASYKSDRRMCCPRASVRSSSVL